MNRARAAALLLAVATLTAAPRAGAQQAPELETARQTQAQDQAQIQSQAQIQRQAQVQIQAQAPTGKPRLRGWTGPKPQIDCRCRHRGGRAELGDVLCIQQGSRWVTAQCQMVLNNPTWRVLKDACELPSS